MSERKRDGIMNLISKRQKQQQKEKSSLPSNARSFAAVTRDIRRAPLEGVEALVIVLRSH